MHNVVRFGQCLHFILAISVGKQFKWIIIFSSVILSHQKNKDIIKFNGKYPAFIVVKFVEIRRLDFDLKLSLPGISLNIFH